MSEREHDVIVVGGGPAGATAALVAARKGLRVVLFDRARFPRDKVCGDAITPLGVAMLRELRLLDDVRAIADETLDHIAIAVGGEARTSRLETPLLVVNRRALDALLITRAGAFADVRQGWHVDDIVREGDAIAGVTGTTPDGRRFCARARVVIGADGATSIVARRAAVADPVGPAPLVATRAYFRGVALDRRAAEFHFVPALAGGYLWIFPAGADRCNVGLCARPDVMASSGRGLRQWRDQLLGSAAFAPRFREASLLSAFEGWPIPTGMPRPLAGAGFVLVGDAAGLADALWGDGIDTAFVSGVLAGAHVAAACRASDAGAERLAGYATSVRRVLASKLAAGAALTQMATLDPTLLEHHLLRTLHAG
ncbi:MAG TPA: geranylgeranyl reductase family protein [Polyangia bacterium]|jgi:geranylgeranyl reductase family protein